jgi:hypothetical protein
MDQNNNTRSRFARISQFQKQKKDRKKEERRIRTSVLTGQEHG